MRKMKKLLSILVAATMTMAMAAPSFADLTTGDGTGDQAQGTEVTKPAPKPVPVLDGANVADDKKGTITIDGAIEGEEYKLYRLFDLQSYYGADSTGTYAYTIKSDSPWFSFFNSGAGAQYVTVDTRDALTVDGVTTYYIKVPEGGLSDANKAEFVREALVHAKTITATATGTANAGGLEFTNAPMGYYLLDSTTGALCSLDTNTPNVAIEEKNEKPSIDKKVMDGTTPADSNTAKIGDTVTYQVTIHAQKGAQAYVLHDDMSVGLTVGDVTSVTIDGGQDVKADATVKKGEETGHQGCDLEVSFSDDFYSMLNDALDRSENGTANIVITYTATLNEQAVIAGEGNTNKASLAYGDNTDITTTPNDTVTTYTYEFDLVKTDANGKILKEEGRTASFKLYGSEEGTDEISLVEAEPNEGKKVYRVASATEKAEEGFTSATIVAGNVIIEGLGNGTYWLEETAAPAGYNKLNARQKVEITNANVKTDLTAEATDYTSTSGGVRVINNTGTELPSTGGIGTTIFYAAGIILMAGEVFFVVRRRRA